MRTKFTLLSSKLFSSLVCIALLSGLMKARAQAPFVGGQTYYVNGVGNDLVAPKDTFRDLTGTYSGGPYTSTTGVVSALNVNGIDANTIGQITILLVSGYSGVEANANGVVVNSIVNASPNRPIVLKPATGLSFTITNAGTGLAANAALLRLNGTQFFTIDGEGAGGSRNLSFVVSSTSPQTNGRVIDLTSTSATSINTIVLKGLNIYGFSNSTNVATFAGVYIGGPTAGSSALRRNAYISVLNCDIQGVQNGVYARGIAASGMGSQDFGLIVRNNRIGGAPNMFIGGGTGSSGIFISNQANVLIENNVISRNLSSASAFKGIELINSASTLSLDSNVVINANSIHNLSANSGGVTGIRVALGNHAAPLAIKVTNNTIAKLIGPGNPTPSSYQYPIGILVEDSAAGMDIVNNSISLTGATLNSGSASACLVTGPLTNGGLRVYNNIFSNRMDNIPTSTNPFNTHAIIVLRNPVNSAVTTPFANIDNNVYDIATTGGWANIGYTAINNYVSLQEWAAFTGQDKSSLISRPVFENDSLLPTSNGAGANYSVFGRPILTTDRIGSSRSATSSSIGAYEFTANSSTALAPLSGGATYLINGIDNLPNLANPSNGSFATYGSFVNHLNSFGTFGTGTITIKFASGYLLDATVPAAVSPYPGMLGTRPIKVVTTPGVDVNLTIDAGKTICSNSGVVRFYGTSFFEIDGDNGSGGKGITISLPASAASNLAKLVILAPTISHSTSYITIKNCNLIGSSTNAGNNNFAAIYMGAANNAAGFANAIGGPNTNILISDNKIEAVRNGIYWRAKTGVTDQFLTITRNVIGGTNNIGGTLPTNYIGSGAANLAGIYVKGISQSVIDSNIIRNAINNSTGFRGIDLDAIIGETGNTFSLNVTRNTIYNLGSQNGYAVGIRASSVDANRSILIANNFIAKIYGTGSASIATLGSPVGISIENPNTASAPVALGISLINNTVHLSQHTTQVSSGAFSAAVYIDSRSNGLIVRNNLFSNKLGRTSAGTVSNCYVYAYGASQPANPFADINSNAYFVGADASFTNNQFGSGVIPPPPAAAIIAMYTLTEHRAFAAGDAQSVFGEMPFTNDSTSAFDLIYVGHFAKKFVRNNQAVTDIIGAPRATGLSTAGAYEVDDRYSPLMGDATYYVNGILAPPTKVAPINGSFNTINSLFRFINTNGVDDGKNPPFRDITVVITNGYTGEGDTSIASLFDYPRMGQYRNITIKPDAGANPTIASTAASIRSQFTNTSSVIRFQGASYVTIDGSNDGGVTRNLTIKLPSTPSNVTYVNNAFARVIDVVGWATPSTNIAIKNCNILGYSNTNTIFTYAGIYQGGIQFNNPTTVPVPQSPFREKNNDNTYSNNFIGAVRYGIHLRGHNNISGGYDLRASIVGNRIGGDTLSSLNPTTYFGGTTSSAGILLANQAITLVDSNVIKNSLPGYNTISGIELSNNTTSLNTDSAITITRNTISNIRTNQASAYGIYTNIRWDGTKAINIFNNFIYGISSAGTAPNSSFAANTYGILLDGSGSTFTDLGINIWNNSINLGAGTSVGASGISACIGVGATTKGQINVLNNILQNKLSRSSNGGNNYAIAVAAATNPFLYTDFNNYNVAGAFGTNNIAGLNLQTATPTNYATLAAWATYTNQDTLSMSIVTPFTNDSNLTIPNGTSSPLYRAGQRIPLVGRDIFNTPRPGISSGVATIGAHEFTGTYLDIFPPKLYDVTKPADICFFDGVPVTIVSRIADRNPVMHDTLYYRINNGTEQSMVPSRTNLQSRYYDIPAQAPNTYIAYRFAGADGASLPIGFMNPDPRTGMNYSTTMLTINDTGKIVTGFDVPNINNWSVEQIAGSGTWDLRSYGSNTNPTIAPITGKQGALFSAVAGSAARLVSPCLDLTFAKKPTLRLFVSQNYDNPAQRDSILVRVGVGFGIWFNLQKGYTIFRANNSFAVPGYKVYDFCMEELYGQSGIKVGIEAYSVGGGAMMIDSIALFDNFITLPVTPKVQTTCYNAPFSVNVSNADSKFEYSLYDALSQKFVGTPVQGNDGTLSVPGFINTLDSAYIQVWARNLTSNCTNLMNDTVIVYFRNYKDGPFVIKGSVFEGQYNTGDFFTPDAVKVGGVARYELAPPRGSSNSTYGTNWTVSRVKMYQYVYDQISDAFVMVDSARNYSLVPPVGGNPGYLLVTGTNTDENKTFQLQLTVKLLPQGCDSTIIRYVTIAKAPTASFFAPNDTLCQEINALMTNLSTTDAFTQPLQYTWDFGDGTYSSGANPTKNYTTPGTYRLKLIAKNNTTLIDSLAINVVVLPSPVANFTSTISCAGKVSRFTSTGTNEPGNFYQFNIGGQVADSNIVDAIVQGSDTTILTRLYVRNTLGCYDTITKPIQVFAQPTAVFSATDVCAGNSVQFTNSSVINAGKNGRVNNFGSEWTFGNGDVGYSNNPSYKYPSGGAYRAMLKVISNYGCTDTVSHIVSVFNKPTVNFTLDNTCKGSNVLIANNTTFAGGLNKVIYNWNFGDNSLPKTEAVPTKSYGAIGSYFVTLLATDTAHGCFDSMRIVAQVKDKAMADFTVNNGCTGKELAFTNQSVVPLASNPSYTYLFGDNASANVPNPTHTYLLGGSKTVKLIVNLDGCRDTATKTTVISAPISIDYTKERLSPNLVKFTANKTGLALYSWDFGDGTPVVNTTSNIVTHIFDRKGTNTVVLTVQDSNACDAIKTDTVEIDRRVGMNDILAERVNFNVYPNPFATSTKVVFDLEKSEKVTLEVYDMLGRKVYTNNAGTMNAGSQSLEINESNFDAKSAVYMIRLTIGSDVISRQLVKQ